MLLNPTAFTKALALGTEDKMAFLEDARINLCIECGCCSFVCPASRPLVQNNRLAKSALREYKAHKSTLK
jgi:electron transport complex protein RnfC